MKVAKFIAAASVSTFTIWGSSCLIRLIRAADNMPGYISIGASALLLFWFVWSVVTISNRQRERNSSDIVFRFGRFTSRLPDEFDHFCTENNIVDRDKFAEDAISEKMSLYRQKKREREQTEQDAAARLGITVERYRALQESIRCNVNEHILRKEKAEQV